MLKKQILASFNIYLKISLYIGNYKRKKKKLEQNFFKKKMAEKKEIEIEKTAKK